MAYPSHTEEPDVMSIERIEMETKASFGAYLNRVAPEVDSRIAEHLARLGSAGAIDKDVERVLLGGKRLRGATVMLSFDVLSRDAERRRAALDLASVVELAHSASLIMDDVIDEDESRRGEPALHILQGEKVALLRTVEVIALPYGIASEHGTRFVELLARTHRLMVNGVLSEISRSNEGIEKQYERVISLKTGALFSLAARYGAMAARADPMLIEAMAEWGLWTGKAMQIADDIADLRQALDGASKRLLGSEMMLLQSIVSRDRPIDDRRLNNRPTLGAHSFSEAGRRQFEARMKQRLDEELRTVEEMTTAIRELIGVRDSSDILLGAPSEIARIIMDETERPHRLDHDRRSIG